MRFLGASSHWIDLNDDLRDKSFLILKLRVMSGSLWVEKHVWGNMPFKKYAMSPFIPISIVPYPTNIYGGKLKEYLKE